MVFLDLIVVQVISFILASNRSKVAFKEFFEVGAMSLAFQGRQLPLPPLDHLEGQGGRTLCGGGFEDGLPHPLLITSSLSRVPIPIPSYSLTSVKWKALRGEVLSLVEKVAVKLTPPSLGYYRRLFVVWKAMGSWRPVIDISHLKRFVQQTLFKMETKQLVLRAVWRGEWMISIDLKDAYFQVPVHPDSRHFLWFVADGQVYQIKALCFGLSTAPQVFIRVMALVSVVLHDLGVRILRYSDS